MNIRVYAPAILLVLCALLIQAGAEVDELWVPFMILEAIAIFGSIRYRWNELRRVERRDQQRGRRRDD